MNLSISEKYEQSKDRWHVSLVGDLDINSSSYLKEKLNDLIDRKCSFLALDFSELSYIDSTGLGVLIGVLNRVKAENCEMVIMNPKTNVEKLLKVTGLNKIFKIIEEGEDFDR